MPMPRKIAFLASDTALSQEARQRLEARYGVHAPEQADVIVALGGDGFMLQTMHATQALGLSVYGMNRGTVGFLMNAYAEDDLIERLDRAEAAIKPAMDKEDFSAAMSAMAALRAPIKAFFTAVQVNSDNDIIRRNRLNLLSRIRTICLSVADLTKLEG